MKIMRSRSVGEMSKKNVKKLDMHIKFFFIFFGHFTF